MKCKVNGRRVWLEVKRREWRFENRNVRHLGEGTRKKS